MVGQIWTRGRRRQTSRISVFSLPGREKDLSAQIAVMKFGGTSVEDALAFERVAHIVRSYERAAPVVVVSAMSGVTDALMMSLRLAAKGEVIEAARSLELHFERHLRVAGGLGVTARAKMRMLIENTRREIIDMLKVVAANRMATALQLDMVTSHGERLSANLLTLILEEHELPAAYVDARRCILTDAEHGSANPLIEETRRRTRRELEPLLDAKKIPVLGGFIGATMGGVTTTLGRGSSDYTATLVSSALGAIETQIWTDVDGVQTADPRLVRSSRTVPRLSYEEAEELARLGARVMHPKMIQPVLEQEIPIRICNSHVPGQIGTLICASTESSTPAVTAIASKTDLTRIDINATPTFVANGFLRAIKEVFNRHHAHMDIVAMSEIGVSLACEEAGTLPSLVQDLKQVGSVKVEKHRAIIGCVGEGLQSAPGGVSEALNMLRDIDSTLTWQSTSRISLMSVVDVDSVGPLVRRLHQGIFERDRTWSDAAPLR